MILHLDNHDKIKEFDTEDMLGVIGRFSINARKALRDVNELDFKSINKNKFNSILVVGMGGSAVGGLLLRDWLREVSEYPIIVSRDFHIPNWVDEKTLVFAVSYSGDTEETYNQYQEALEKGCKVICFCSGGKMRRSASLRKIPLVLLPKHYKPRAAIASQFYSLAGVAKRIDLVSNEKWDEVEESIEIVESIIEELQNETPIKDNPAKQLAEGIYGLIPFIFGTKLFETVAYRYSTQFNENSKSPASTSYFPEAFHNNIMAREGKEEIMKNICGVLINDPLEEEPIKYKIKKFRNIIKENIGRLIEIDAIGKGKLARIMSVLTIGDYASAYLGILYEKDPSTTDSIQKLK